LIRIAMHDARALVAPNPIGGGTAEWLRARASAAQG
jgi:hypothetical protein